MQSVKKGREPLELITTWPSLGSNNLNQTSPVVANQTYTKVRRNFGSFLFIKLIQVSSIPRLSGLKHSLEVMLQHLNRVKVSTFFPPFCCWFTSIWVIGLLSLCWCSVGGQMVFSFPAKCLDKLGNSFFQSMTAICPGPQEAKQSQTMIALHRISWLGWGFNVGVLWRFSFSI